MKENYKKKKKIKTSNKCRFYRLFVNCIVCFGKKNDLSNLNISMKFSEYFLNIP